ncbi:MAG: polyhydroxyalkanoic acid system family protein [Bdellovibrionales bacterium]|nr:polyhydroxyalkanoic acid system family protein [Bdellovibrionales bacterium]
MPKFTVEHQTSSDTKDTYNKLKDFFTNSDEIKKIDPKVSCSFNDDNLTCKLNGSQFKADVQVSSNSSGSLVNVNVDLPLLLSPFKGKVQEGLQKMLKKHLG